MKPYYLFISIYTAIWPLGQGYTVDLDNWCKSPAIFQKLTNEEINAIGTVRLNRKNMPKDFKSKKQDINIRKQKESKRRYKGSYDDFQIVEE